MVSLAGPRVIDRYTNRLKQSTTAVKSVTGNLNRIVGELKVSLEVGGYISTLSLKAIQGIEHDLILGGATRERITESQRRRVDVLSRQRNYAKPSRVRGVRRNFRAEG